MRRRLIHGLPLLAGLLLIGCGETPQQPPNADASQAADSNDRTPGDAKPKTAQVSPAKPSAEEVAIAALETRSAYVERNADGAAVTVVMPEDATDDEISLLADLNNLEALSLAGARLNDVGWKAVGKLDQLQALYLYRTNIGDSGVAHLEDLPHLRVLSLAWTDITDVGLAALRDMQALEELDVAWTSVSDVGLRHLNGLENLQAIVIAGSDISAGGLADLRQDIPDLQEAEEDTVARAPETPAPLDLEGLERPGEPGSGLIGQAAQEIEGEDIDGVPFKLSDYRGKVVMLDFWGDW